MGNDATNSPARERVLNIAERLFTERGYRAVTLRDIADTLGMRPASLYNHAPGGKEQLFVEVTERGLDRHRTGIEQAIRCADPNLRAQLRAAARWLLSQPPLNLCRMLRSDMPAIDPEQAAHLTQAAYQALLAPIEQAVREAYQRGDIRAINGLLVARTFIATIESLHDLPRYDPTPVEVLADDVIDMWLDGLNRSGSDDELHL